MYKIISVQETCLLNSDIQIWRQEGTFLNEKQEILVICQC